MERCFDILGLGGVGAVLGLVGAAFYLKKRSELNRFMKDRKAVPKGADKKLKAAGWSTCAECGAKLRGQNMKPHMKSVHSKKYKGAS